MPASRRLIAVLAATLLLARPTSADVIPASEAGDHVGQAQTVEGVVTEAHMEGDNLVLELAPPEEKGFRVVLVIGLFSDVPRHPERLYVDRRVQASGIIQRFHGRPEMIVESASQIQVVDVAGPAATPPPPTSTTLPSPARAPEAAPAAPAVVTPPQIAPAPPPAPPPAPAPAGAPTPTPAPAPAAPPAAVPPPAPAAATPPAPAVAPAPAPVPPAPVPPTSTTLPEQPAAKPLLTERIAEQLCERARTRWRDAAARVREASATLARCLDAESYRCRDAAAALAPALTDLEWAEQQVEDRCD